MKPWYLKVSPESYSRYFLISQILFKHFGQQPFKLLELGGKGSYLPEMLDNLGMSAEVTVLDILEPPEAKKGYKYIQGDATSTGIKSGTFDAVVSTDTLEHIPDSKKAAFILESLRLSRRLAIIAAPFDSEAVRGAEDRANSFYAKLTGAPHVWLEEHKTAGLPKREEVEKLLDGQRYLAFGSSRLDLWLPNLALNMLPEAVTVDHDKVDSLNEFYNQHLTSMGDFSEPTYRRFYVVFKEGQPEAGLADYVKAVTDASARKEYVGRLQQFLGDELHVRISLLQGDQRADLEKEILILQEACGLMGKGYSAKKIFSLAKKTLRHPAKALWHLRFRLPRRN